jgi:hypothetical protein
MRLGCCTAQYRETTIGDKTQAAKSTPNMLAVRTGVRPCACITRVETLFVIGFAKNAAVGTAISRRGWR